MIATYSDYAALGALALFGIVAVVGISLLAEWIGDLLEELERNRNGN